jgi:hypothetical protein
MSEKHNIIPVWFFVGVLFLIYGALIFVSGLANWSNLPKGIELADLHAPVWWGALLFVMGLFYCINFRPKKT